MASSSTNSTNNSKEQLLVCWLEPQSDAGKVSAIPISWIVSAVSGDGRSPDSVVRCRWPRTKRLYRARIVSTAEAKKEEDGEEPEESEIGQEEIESPTPTPTTIQMKEESKLPRPSTTVASSNAGTSNQQQPITTPSIPHQSGQLIDAATLAQALLPTLKKLFNNELSKLSTDIQANFDILGHKISALDGTVKCIKTRVDRMETLLNSAAQELGDTTNVPTTTTSRSSPMNGNDLSGSSIAKNLNFTVPTSTYSLQQQQAAARSAAAAAVAARYNMSIPNRISTPVNSVPKRPSMPAQSKPSTTNASNKNGSSIIASFSKYQLPTLVSTTLGQRTTLGSISAPSSSLKRRRPTANTNPILPKAVVVTAPNGVDIYLGGDKNYKMPLVMYKDALKNCTRPVPTYMVMALIRRYLTPDQMSRTWLTEQQLMGKRDGMLLDQGLLTSLKKQAVMQFPGSGIDDRLLVRKLYDVFHGIRRQMRKKRRAAGEDSGDDMYGTPKAKKRNGAEDADDSGSGNHGDDDHESDFGDDHNDFDGDEDGGVDHDQVGDDHQNEDDAGLLGHEGSLNGDEDLEEMAAKQAAFWAGADDSY